jgi:bifunctional N-acetylglucosamine-1-phosphate-uridyltransferase/glucosamine-1-phosphate-acetyltransferase GlmU-like protein
MVERMYAAVPKNLHGAAGHTVLAHLIHMVATGRASCERSPNLRATYRLR